MTSILKKRLFHNENYEKESTCPEAISSMAIKICFGHTKWKK